MSTQQKFERELHTSALYGMGNIQGDPEALAEIGIPTDEAAFIGHIASGRIVNRVQDTVRNDWIESMHLTGEPIRKTEAERQANSDAVSRVKSYIVKG